MGSHIASLRSLPAGQSRAGRAPRRVDRLSSGDVVQLSTDIGPVPMQIGACLALDAGPGFEAGPGFDTGPGFDASAMRRCVADQILAIPRLRQRLVRTPPGCGRPVARACYRLGALILSRLRGKCPYERLLSCISGQPQGNE